MSGGEIEQTRVLDILLQFEGDIERIVEHEYRIRLACLFHIVDRIEQRQSLGHIALALRIVLELEAQTMSIGVPVAYVGTNPHLALELFSHTRHLSLVQHRVSPSLSGHLIMIVLAHTEAREESHQLKRNVISGSRHQCVIVGRSALERRHAVEIAQSVEKRLLLAGRNHED